MRGRPTANVVINHLTGTKRGRGLLGWVWVGGGGRVMRKNLQFIKKYRRFDYKRKMTTSLSRNDLS